MNVNKEYKPCKCQMCINYNKEKKRCELQCKEFSQHGKVKCKEFEVNNKLKYF